MKESQGSIDFFAEIVYSIRAKEPYVEMDRISAVSVICGNYLHIIL